MRKSVDSRKVEQPIQYPGTRYTNIEVDKSKVNKEYCLCNFSAIATSQFLTFRNVYDVSRHRVAKSTRQRESPGYERRYSSRYSNQVWEKRKIGWGGRGIRGRERVFAKRNASGTGAKKSRCGLFGVALPVCRPTPTISRAATRYYYVHMPMYHGLPDRSGSRLYGRANSRLGVVDICAAVCTIK